MGSSELTHCSALLAHVAFALLGNQSFSQGTGSHISAVSILSSIPPAKFTTAEEGLDVGSLRRITCAVSCRGTGKATVSWKDAEDRIHLS